MESIDLFAAADLDTLLAVAATLLGLALLVQVVQEIYKYVTSSQSRIYRLVLRDFLGAWVDRLYEPGPATRFHVRGPFQFQLFRSQPTGKLLPMGKDELLQAIDELAPDWIRHTIEVFEAERRLQGEFPGPPSPAFHRYLGRLQTAAEEDPSPHSNAAKARRFLVTWGVVRETPEGLELAEESHDPRRLLKALHQEFVPFHHLVERDFPRLERNYRHANARHNLRYTFLIAFALALSLNFPFDAIVDRATALSPEEAVSLAQTMREMRREVDAATEAAVEGPDEEPEEEAGTDGRDPAEELGNLADQILQKLPQYSTDPLYRQSWDQLRKEPLPHLFYCLVTALLVSFGAPFWDRLSEALLSIRRRHAPVGTSSEEGSP